MINPTDGDEVEIVPAYRGTELVCAPLFVLRDSCTGITVPCSSRAFRAGVEA